MLLLPMLRDGQEALGSMGNDSPLACMSGRPRLLYEHFKQLFAQVTNPPLDSTREYIVMSLRCFIGPEGDFTHTTEEQAHRLVLESPILRLAELEDIKNISHRGWSCSEIDATFPVGSPQLLEENIGRICDEVDAAIEGGCRIVVLTDRATSAERVPISSMLACGAVHHHLVRTATHRPPCPSTSPTALPPQPVPPQPCPRWCVLDREHKLLTFACPTAHAGTGPHAAAAQDRADRRHR